MAAELLAKGLIRDIPDFPEPGIIFKYRHAGIWESTFVVNHAVVVDMPESPPEFALGINVFLGKIQPVGWPCPHGCSPLRHYIRFHVAVPGLSDER